MDELQRKFAIADRFEGEGVVLSTAAVECKVKLQLVRRADVGAAVLGEALSMVLPSVPMAPASSGPTVFWCAPNEWLVVGGAPAAEVRSAVAARLAGRTHAVTDLTDSLMAIEVSGSSAVALLAESCGVDLHPQVFEAGHYALTRFGHVTAILHRLPDAGRFHLYVDRSVAAFVWDWLVDGVKKNVAFG